MTTDSILEIRKAEREGAALVFGLCGPSGSGKTRTAIELAYGLANFKADKIGFLDAENRRGSLYADILPDKFWIGDLFPPFSPERYIGAIRQFEKMGVEVLIIDSVSHEWEGTGGVREIAAKAGNYDSPRWDMAKDKHHKPFINCMLQSPMHIICCLRARESAHKEQVLQEDGSKKMMWINDGMVEIQEKNFLFEMTTSLMMYDSGKRQEIIKCDGRLMEFLGRKNGYITADDGKKIREWVDGAKKLDPEVERWRNIVQNTAAKGSEELKKIWEKEVPTEIKKALGKPFIASVKASAEEFDAAGIQKTGNDVVDNLNSVSDKKPATAKPSTDDQIC